MKVFFLSCLFLAFSAKALVLPPGPPSALTASFSFMDSAQGLTPSVNLSWEASAAQTFLLAGYVITRQEAGGNTQVVSGTDKNPWPDESFRDLGVGLEKTYTWRVWSVDAKGNSSEASSPVSLDLASLPESLLLPEAPKGLTARGGRNQVSLRWSRPRTTAEPISRYLVFRSDPGSLPSGEGQTSWAEDFLDTPPAKAQLYDYWVRSVDAKGRNSPSSLSATAEASGTVLPGAPKALTAKVEVAKVKLSWEASVPGTAAVSEYLVQRRRPDGTWHDFPPKMPSYALSFSEGGLDADRPVLYQVLAVDAEGNTSKPSQVEAQPLPPRFVRNAIILMPTAYLSGEESGPGLGFNLGASYYIGNFYEYYQNPKLGRVQTPLLSRTNVGTGTLDLKWCVQGDRGLAPALGSGIYLISILSGNQASQDVSQSLGASSSSGSNSPTLGGAYFVLSKTLAKRTAVHLGYLRGRLAESLVRLAPPSWELTLRHMSPGGDVADLFSNLVDANLGIPTGSSPDLLFGGTQVPITVPLWVTSWKTGLSAEFLAPFGGGEKTPFMLNFHVINMPFFGAEQFMFSYMKYFQGYQISGFVHFNLW
jgi:hypothetical protein